MERSDIRRLRLLSPRQHIEDHISAGDTCSNRLAAGGLDSVRAVGQHSGEDLYHLPVALLISTELGATVSIDPGAPSP